jgi:hypothetical protein
MPEPEPEPESVDAVLGRIHAGGGSGDLTRTLHEAIAALRDRRGGSLPVDVVLRFLRSDVPWVREMGVAWAGSADPPPVDTLLALQAGDPDVDVRARATLAVAQIAGERPDVRSRVVGALADPEWPVRNHAVFAVWSLADARPDLGRHLLDLVDDPHPTVRRAAIGRAANLGVEGLADHAVAAIRAGEYDDRVLRDLSTSLIRAGRVGDVLGADLPADALLRLFRTAYGLAYAEDPVPGALAPFRPEIPRLLSLAAGDDVVDEEILRFAADAGAWDRIVAFATDPRRPGEPRARAVAWLLGREDGVRPGLDAAERLLFSGADRLWREADGFWLRAAAEEELRELER